MHTALKPVHSQTLVQLTLENRPDLLKKQQHPPSQMATYVDTVLRPQALFISVVGGLSVLVVVALARGASSRQVKMGFASRLRKLRRTRPRITRRRMPPATAPTAMPAISPWDSVFA